MRGILMKSMEISNEQCLPYKFLLKKHKTVFYNPLILLTLYKTNQQKIKTYHAFTLKFYDTRLTDYICGWKSAKSNELWKTSFVILCKSVEPLCAIA